MIINEDERLKAIIKKLKDILTLNADISVRDKMISIIEEQEKSEDVYITKNQFLLICNNSNHIMDFASGKRTQKTCRLLCELQKVAPHLINPLDYYSEVDVFSYNTYIDEDLIKRSYKTLYNVEKKAENQYALLLSVADIADMVSNNDIYADPEYQRKSILVENSVGNTIRRVKINYIRVQEIAQKIKKQQYWFDEIRLSLVNDSNAKLYYDEKKKTLNWDGKLLITDGYHRAQACQLVCSENIGLRDVFSSMKFSVSFSLMSYRDIQRSLNQIWNMEPIEREKKKLLQVDPVVYEIVNDIRKEGSGAERLYADLINESSTSPMNVRTLAEAIAKYYNVSSKTLSGEKKRVTQFLIDYFNLVVEEFTDIYVDPLTYYKDGYWMTTRAGLHGLVYYSSVLYKTNKKQPFDWEFAARVALHKVNPIDVDFCQNKYRPHTPTEAANLYIVNKIKQEVSYGAK